MEGVMLEDLRNASSKIVGMKQTLKAVGAGLVKQVYLAKDIDDFVSRKIKEHCEKHQVSIIYVESMEDLGKACGIDVGASTVAVLND